MADLKPQPESSWLLIILWTLSVLVAIVSLRFLVAEIELVMPFMLHHFEARPISLYLHIGLAPVALILLPVQFHRRLRECRPKMHKWTGRLYAITVLVAGVAGFVLGLNTEAGPVASLGFMSLGLVWIGSTTRAVYLAMQRRITEHRAWMIRSAALTVSAVTLRLYLPIGELTIGFETAYPMIAWLCWVPNLLVAEWLLRVRPRLQAA